MFNHRCALPKVNLTTERLHVRLVYERDAQILTEYYSENRGFLKNWEPARDYSYYSPSSWLSRLINMVEQQNRGDAFYFLLLDKSDNELCGVINFTHVVRGTFQACYLGYSLSEAAQGKGLMQEGLKAAIDYLEVKENIHRIMASVMPHNIRSLAVLEKLNFDREGLAKAYLQINGQWQDHYLLARTNHQWKSKNAPSSW